MPDSSTALPEPIDLLHLGRPRVIGAWLLGDVIVDPGPASCLPVLLDALGERPAAGAGTDAHPSRPRGCRGLARAPLPGARGVGARARRAAPGRSEPAAGERHAAVRHGDGAAVGRGSAGPGRADQGAQRGREGRRDDRRLHARARLPPRQLPARADAAGRSPGTSPACASRGGPTIAPTPPPDIDLAAWRSSIELIGGWRPEALAITHFAAHHDVAAQLDELGAHLDEAEQLAATLDEQAFTAARARARGGAGRCGDRGDLRAGDAAVAELRGAAPVSRSRLARESSRKEKRLPRGLCG